MTFLRTAARLAALLALAAIPAAAAEEPGAATRFRIGRLEATALLDGTMSVPNDGKTFGLGRPPSEVAAVLRANGLSTERLDLSIQPLLVRAGPRILLFDTGAGDATFIKAGRLPASLKAAGVEPGQVTDIFVSHGHFDHVGGLLAKGGGLAFPNAAIHMAAPEWAALQANRSQAALVAAIAPKLAAFAPGAVILPGLVTAVPVNGHTPGHSAYEIGTGKDRLLYIGDSAHHEVISVQRPDWTIDYDTDAPRAEASRRALLQRAAAEGLRLYSPHFPYPGVGHVEARGDAFLWVPQAP
ncbi:MBL fold metallo-hydrolase [Phenylobacterium sp.]|uniref:MBL fold metallo-hydrolase n=1 Tax=Phenylobacterium sp. TaxID=1871053 RepID=UPI0035B243D3